MDPSSPLSPLVRWDGAHLILDRERIESRLARRVEGDPHLEKFRLAGAGDTVVLQADVLWKGIRTRARLEIAEIRLRHRLLGFRVRAVRALGGMPVPRWIGERIVRAAAGDRVRFFGGDGVVVVDLTDRIPAAVDLSVVTVQISDRAVHLWLGPGSLADIPARPRPRLAATARDGPGTG